MQIVDIDFCVPADIKSLVDIEAVCFDIPWEERLIEYDLNEPGNSVYLKATVKGTIAGYGVLGRADDTAHLMNLAVLPEYRRNGIALQLMAAFDQISEDWRCRRMCLEVRSNNNIARDFYASMGFVYASRVKGYYSDGEDALVLTARLPLRFA
ncbi:MAG: ribosomal protein S18-alanine N-acetyltransferase [Synergistaceae bacterium]|jgi:ribosomal-protein-alanine N-acetyltransferase|nr:ribosomal protein S18-alanine N-acetyltransferase [Synergistaceae bacterium]